MTTQTMAQIQKCIGLVALALLAACGGLSSTPTPDQAPTISTTLVIRNANVVRLDPTAEVLAAHSVHLDGERVSWVGPARTEPPAGNAMVVDAAGAYLLAGLSEMHAHLPTADDPVAIDAYLKSALQAGITSVRSMRGHPSHPRLRAEIQAGQRAGPDLLLASAVVAVDTLSRQAADDVAEAAKQQGADFIKLLRVGDLESYQNLARAAAARGLAIAGHLPATVTVQQAAAAGQLSIEHLHGVHGALKRSRQEADDFAKQAAKTAVFQCPTLFWYAVQGGVYRASDLADFNASSAVSAAVEAQWKAKLDEEWADSPTRESPNFEPLASRFEATRLLFSNGAKLVVGADASGVYAIPGPAYHRELSLLAQAGIDPASILRAATINAAALRGTPATQGRVAVGQLANLVLVGANPLDDIRNLRDVRTVIHRGRRVVDNPRPR